MANTAGKLVMKVLTIAISIPVGRAAKKLVARAWVSARPENPPHGAKDADAHWGDAIGYAALAAAGGVAAQLVTRKGAETGYRKLTGLQPPPPPPTKAQKKLAKAQRKAAKQPAKEPITAS